MSEFRARMRMHYGFSKLEIKDIVVLAVIMGFLLGFDDGQDTFDLMNWLVNLLISVAIALFTVLISLTAQKAMGYMKGYLIDIKLFLFGVIGGTVLGLASLGRIILLPAIEMVFNHHEGLRLGRFRYGLNYFEMATVAMMGPVANFAVALIVKALAGPNPAFIMANIIKINVLYAIASMLPIPKTAGSYLFFGSPGLFFWVFAPITISGLLLLFLSFWPALIIGLGAGALVALAYFFKVEYK